MTALKNLWFGIVYCFSPLIRKEIPESHFTAQQRQVGIAFSPLRGIICAVAVLIPFFFLTQAVKRLDTNSTQLLLPLLFCLIIERLTHLRRINAFCRCVEAASAPAKAAQIMQTNGPIPLTANGIFMMFFLLGAKLLVLYILVTKVLVGGMKADSELLVDFALMITAIPVFAELGSVLLLTGDGNTGNAVVKGTPPEKDFKALLPLLAAVLLTLPLAVLIWLRLSQNAVILPGALVMFMVFYWKHHVDKSIGKLDRQVGWACYESCELAAMTGLLIV